MALNEISTCASEQMLSRGVSVIAPSKYGLDYSVVVNSAMHTETDTRGPIACQSACLQKNMSMDTGLTESIPQDHTITEKEKPVPIAPTVGWIERIATEEDEARLAELAVMEEEAIVLCREKIVKHNLDMKLVLAHYVFGEPKILFFFTAASRIDFRLLVKDLVSIFRIRIELRQIGVRDESRMLGGLAVCGRDFCCHGVTDKMNTVTIKMAKEQNLSLNSTKISGPCGRLLCCLAYEYDLYAEEKRKLPAEGSRIKVRQNTMKITEVNILSRKISLMGSDGCMLSIPFSAIYRDAETSRWEITHDYLDEFLPS